MKIAFIACEYNPFHNGHKYHLDTIKKAGFDAIVCIMSGNFVQRGDIALFEKHKRAQTAIMNGADIVIELPLKFAVSTASHFADGFIKTAKATGLMGSVSFGAKSSIDDLMYLEEHLFCDDADEFCSKKVREGINYPNAKKDFIEEKLGEHYSKILSDGNNTLALEYLRAKKLYFSEADVFCVERIGADHDSDTVSSVFCSASFLRERIYDNNDSALAEKIGCFIPDNTLQLIESLAEEGRFPRDLNRFEASMLARLSMSDASYFSEINNVTEGLENRIAEAIKISNTTSEILYNVKSKRFTYSRLRQILINAAIGITRADIENGLSYIRILGFNDKGRAIIRSMKDNAALPVISNLSEINSNDESALRDAFLDYQAGKLFSLCDPILQSGNPEYEIPPIYVK